MFFSEALPFNQSEKAIYVCFLFLCIEIVIMTNPWKAEWSMMELAMLGEGGQAGEWTDFDPATVCLIPKSCRIT